MLEGKEAVRGLESRKILTTLILELRFPTRDTHLAEKRSSISYFSIFYNWKIMLRPLPSPLIIQKPPLFRSLVGVLSRDIFTYC